MANVTNKEMIDTSKWIDMKKVKEIHANGNRFMASGPSPRKQVERSTTTPKRKILQDFTNYKPDTGEVKRRNLFEDLPDRSPPYKYKRGPCRKKSERAKLPGQCCDDCHSYYEKLVSMDGYTEEEVQEMKNKVHRHRHKYPIRSNTPPGFWNPVFSDEE